MKSCAEVANAKSEFIYKLKFWIYASYQTSTHWCRKEMLLESGNRYIGLYSILNREHMCTRITKHTLCLLGLMTGSGLHFVHYSHKRI